MFSVLILTLNEEADLPLCLASLGDCDDVVVLDSGSTDRTCAIATAAGARVFTRRFDNFAGQRNFAQREIGFRHPWVFHLDADERLTPELIAECRTNAVRTDLEGFHVAPKMLWEGRWIPHCTDFPAWQARFVRAPEFAFVEVGHGQREAPGTRLGRLSANYLHHLTSGGPAGEAEWIEKHRRYARAEARAYLSAVGTVGWRDLVHTDRLRRRRAMKHFSYVLPGRPCLRFVYQYILRRGFLDGRPGLHYCRLLARYEGFAAAELRALRSQNSK